ncbi:MAG: antibiotic biosynthesis monooxygenase [Alphaproteobacteria bacterium]|nr:antibiotic biosynthesis monooxygenase [Alphaproteobacteria bacterium]
MMDTTDPAGRTAALPRGLPNGPVTLINSFVVRSGREDAFLALWTATSTFFRAQPGFQSLRLHRSLSPDARYRFVNVADWSSGGNFATAHAAEEFKRLIGQERWKEFPSSPTLYEVVAR